MKFCFCEYLQQDESCCLNTSLRSPEYDTLQVKRVFNDARGGDSNPQHILLGGKVRRLGDPVQRVQVTTDTHTHTGN